METNFNFKSQPCTSREQSERLLTLGLKKETADMIYERNVQYPYDYDLPRSIYEGEEFITGVKCDDILAWSLHRLIEIMGANNIQHWLGLNVERDFDLIIDTIEELIKEGYFNKEYLEE